MVKEIKTKAFRCNTESRGTFYTCCARTGVDATAEKVLSTGTILTTIWFLVRTAIGARTAIRCGGTTSISTDYPSTESTVVIGSLVGVAIQGAIGNAASIWAFLWSVEWTIGYLVGTEFRRNRTASIKADVRSLSRTLAASRACSF